MSKANNRPFQINSRKHKTDLFERSRTYKKKTTRRDEFYNKVAMWTSFYRANPHRFVKDYLNLGFELKLFQQILLYMMFHNYYFAYIASRGQGVVTNA